MTITVFENGRGLIHGEHNNEIVSKIGGRLIIGEDSIDIKEKSSTEIPVICSGRNCTVKATFCSNDGRDYQLLDVTIDSGKLVPPNDDYENLVNDYQLINALTDNIITAEENLEIMRNRKQRAIISLMNNRVKSFIE